MTLRYMLLIAVLESEKQTKTLRWQWLLNPQNEILNLIFKLNFTMFSIFLKKWFLFGIS